MLDHLSQTEWSKPPSIVSENLPVVDARRCTVQLENGFLYLDVIAAPAHALLGYDAPQPARTSASRAVALIDLMAEGYRCVALTATHEEAVAIAMTMAPRRCGQADVQIIDAHDGEPATTPETFIVVENQSLGRAGRWLASAGWRRRPNFVVVGDALSAGAPFGAVLAAMTDGTTDTFAPPIVACDDATLDRVGATIQSVIAEQLLEGAPALDNYFRERLKAVRETCREIGAFNFSPLRVLITLRTPNAGVRNQAQIM